MPKTIKNPRARAKAEMGGEVCSLLRETVVWLQAQRAESLSPHIRRGINFSIIVSSACWLEGSIEFLLRFLWATNAQDNSPTTRRCIDYTIDETLGGAGLRPLEESLPILFGEPASRIVRDAKSWEDMRALIKFRNVLAHGRGLRQRISYIPGGEGQTQFSWPPEDYHEAEVSGIRNWGDVEVYLRKRKIQVKKIASLDCYLSNAVADHFWCGAQHFIKKVIASVPQDQRPVLEAMSSRVLFGEKKTFS